MISKMELKQAYNMDVVLETHAQDLIMKVSEQILAEPLDEYSTEVAFYTPSNWWEHFKESFFPKFWTERFPIKKTKNSKTVTYKVKALYPTLKDISGLESHIHVMKEVK